MADNRLKNDKGAPNPEPSKDPQELLPPDESGARPPKPANEKNSDQGKLQEKFESQKHEGSVRGNRTPRHATKDGL